MSEVVEGRLRQLAERDILGDTIERIIWGFASLDAEDRARAIAAFNQLHDDPRNQNRYKIEEVT